LPLAIADREGAERVEGRRIGGQHPAKELRRVDALQVDVLTLDGLVPGQQTDLKLIVKRRNEDGRAEPLAGVLRQRNRHGILNRGGNGAARGRGGTPLHDDRHIAGEGWAGIGEVDLDGHPVSGTDHAIEAGEDGHLERAGGDRGSCRAELSQRDNDDCNAVSDQVFHRPRPHDHKNQAE